MGISRRWFIGGSAAILGMGLAPLKMLAARPLGKLRLRFGVVSDIHFRFEGLPGDGFGRNFDDSTFLAALRWFRDQRVDAVVIAGDMADRGMKYELQSVADAWFSVFPNDRRPDGRCVNRVFVTGNHDWMGFAYGDAISRLYPDALNRRKHILQYDIERTWAEVFHEAYRPFFVKRVNGFPFVCAHWNPGSSTRCTGNTFPGVADFIMEKARGFDPKEPFFYIQHPHLRNTCYGEWAWGHDSGFSTRALAHFSNAVAFSGHSHYSLTDERSIWQGEFLSIGTASLRYSGIPVGMFPRGSFAFENSSSNVDKSKRKAVDAVKMMTAQDSHKGRQGMLVSVYEDSMVFQRRSFSFDEWLGPDWVVPLQNAESKPFAHLKRRKEELPPRFARDARLVVARGIAKDRKGKRKKCYTVSFPNVFHPTRALYYSVEARQEDGACVRRKEVLAIGFDRPEACALESYCTFAADELPAAGRISFSVIPRGSFGTAGEALVTSVDMGSREVS